MTPLVAGSLWSVPREHQVAAIEAGVAAGLTWLHWDHTDGVFAAPGGFSRAEAGRLDQLAALRHEVHLMVTEPHTRVDEWTDLCDRIIVHLETPDWARAVDRVHRRGAEAAVAISPHTAPDVVPADLAVLCMSVVPGRAGSEFDRTALDKVAQLAEVNPDRPIGLDGGVTRAVADEASSAGANWLVVGTDLFRPGGLSRWQALLT